MSIDPASAAAAYANASRHGGASAAASATSEAATAVQGPSFADFVQDAVQEAVATGHQAEAAALNIATGEGDIVDVVTAIAAAEMTIETVVAVRDKMVSAYQEIMRMPM